MVTPMEMQQPFTLPSKREILNRPRQRILPLAYALPLVVAEFARRLICVKCAAPVII